jgi:hypothetical protein
LLAEKRGAENVSQGRELIRAENCSKSVSLYMLLKNSTGAVVCISRPPLCRPAINESVSNSSRFHRDERASPSSETPR